MAAHLPVHEDDENKVISRIVRTIKKTRYFRTSLRYFDIPDDRFKETPNDEVYACNRNVPESMVWGGRATFEIHTEPLAGGGRKVTNVYLVA